MRKLLYALAATTLLFTAWAQAAPELRSDHPERYTVVKGDTLWDISARFFEQPLVLAGNLAGKSPGSQSSFDLPR